MTEELANTEAAIRKACVKHAGVDGALLPVLHEVENSVGYVSDAALRLIADQLNMSRAQVFGVLTFYHDFRRQPPAAHTLKVCRAEACQAVGGRDIWAAAKAADTTSAVAVEAVYCLGNCACAPAVRYDGRTLGRVDRAQVSALLVSADDTKATP